MPDEDVDKGTSVPESAGAPAPKPAEVTSDDLRIAALRESSSAADTPAKVEGVLEDVATGGNDGVAGLPETSGSLTRALETPIGYDSSKDPMVIAADNAPDPRVFLDKPMGSDARAAIQAIVDRKMNLGDAGDQAPDVPPATGEPAGIPEARLPAVSSVDAGRDPLAVTPAQAEAGVKRILPDGAEDRGGGVIGPSAADRNEANGGAPDQLAGTSSGVETPAEPPVPPVGPPPTDTGAEDRGDDSGDESSNGTPPEPPTATTEPSGSEAATLTPPLAEDDADDDVDFSNLNPVGGTPPAKDDGHGTDGEGGGGDGKSPDDGAEHGAGAAADFHGDVEFTMASRKALREDLKSIPHDELVEQLEDTADRTQTLYDMLNSQGVPREQKAEIMKQWQESNANLQILKREQRRRTKGSAGGGEEDKDIRRRIDQETEDLRRYSAKTSDQLAESADEINSVVEGLKARKDDARDPKEIAEIDRRISAENSRLVVIEKLRTEKEIKEKKKKEEDEAKGKSEEYERQQLGSASSKDIQSRIENLRTPLSDVQTEMRNIEKELADKGITEERKKELIDKRNKLLPNAIDLQKRFDELDGALVKAQQREADRLRPGDAGRFEPLKNISGEKFKNLTDEQRQNHLRELGKDMRNLAPDEFDNITRRIKAGEDLSLVVSARYAKELGNRLMKDGRRGYDMKELAQLKVTNPEIHAVAMDMYISSEAGKQQAKELFPNNWQKMLKFAKGKSWLIALLILLAGSTTVVAGKAFGNFDDSPKKY